MAEKSNEARPEIKEEKKSSQQIITAEELAKEFREHSVAEFFRRNKQMLGLVGKIRTLTTIIHEFTTNSLDACEEAHILPEIEIQINELGPEYYEVIVKDNGPGLTMETVGKAFGQLLAGTKFHRLIQMRGQQGIGASGMVMLSQITTGKAVKVITGTGKGKAISLEITVDAKKNEPKMMNVTELKKEFRGTIVKAQYKDVKYIRSEQGPLEYLRRTAIANPHAKITFIEPTGEKIVFNRTSNIIPKRPVEIKPHPAGVTVDELISMAKYSNAKKISSFLKNEFDRIGNKAIEEIAKGVHFDLNKDPKKLTWEEAEEIIQQFKKINFIAPTTEGLRPIGEERIAKSLKAIVEPEYLAVTTRKPAVYAGGFPFQVEAAVAYGGKAGREFAEGESKIEIMRFANLAPLLFDAGGCAITKAVQSIDWKRYNIKDLENTPLTVLVNLVSVHIPYTSAGKQAIAEQPEILEEIRLALMECGRKIGQYLSGKRKEQEKQLKREIFYKYIPEVAFALNRITKVDKTKLEKALERLVLEKLKLEEVMEKQEIKEKRKSEKIENEIEIEEEES